MSSAQDSWATVPHDVTLSRDEVHVWRASLDLPAPRLQNLCCTLDTDELHRAERFRFEHDRRRFVARRGLLRTILARYVNARPERLHMRNNAFGKPALWSVAGDDDLTFSLSHSRDLAVLAVTRTREVGIDLERIRSSIASDVVATCFFSKREVEALRALPPEWRQEAFFHCWTCKEAYVKAIGQGLSFPLACFAVCVDPRQPPALVGNDIDASEISRWSLHMLGAHDECKTALVVEGHDWRLRCLQWSEYACAGEAMQ